MGKQKKIQTVLFAVLALLPAQVTRAAVDGNLVVWGYTTYDERDLQLPLRQLACSAWGTLALRVDGRVVFWGGQSDQKHLETGRIAPVPADVDNVAQVSGGCGHAIALRYDGTIRCWGDSAFGQADAPPGLSNITQVSAGLYHTIALVADGTVTCWGAGKATGNTGTNVNYNQSVVPTALSGVKQVAGGGYHTAALKQDGTVVCWGAGSTGSTITPNCTQSIVPSTVRDVTQVAAGGYHNVALKQDGTVACWGAGASSTYHQYNFKQSLVPTGLVGVSQVAAGGFHSIALKQDGTVVCWGAGTSENGGGARGQSMVPTDVAGVTQVSGGWLHTAALKRDGSFRCWGDGEQLQCGAPPQLASAGLQQISRGWAHFAAVTADGGVMCWGSNYWPYSPVSGVQSPFAGQCQVPSGLTDVVQVAAGGTFTLALERNGMVKAWGDRVLNGTIATGIAAISAGSLHYMLLTRDGVATPYGSPFLSSNSSLAQSIASGAEHAMSIGYGTVFCWGRNSSGQCLGNDASGNPIFNYPCGGGCDGRNTVESPQIPLVKGTTRMSGGMAQVAGGYYHSMARTQAGKVYCWGSNSYGQCDVPPQLDGVVSIGAGAQSSLALKSDGSVVAWGDVVEGVAPAGLGRIAKLGVSGGHSGTLALRFPVCSDDLDETGSIDFGDIALAMLDFGPCEACRSDQDQNGTVDFGDVALLLLGFGPCP